VCLQASRDSDHTRKGRDEIDDVRAAAARSRGEPKGRHADQRSSDECDLAGYHLVDEDDLNHAVIKT
jgi:hypothetical protein